MAISRSMHDTGGCKAGCALHCDVYDRCMSSRTQIYLTDEQRRRIDRVAAAKGMSMAEVVRSAVDDYLDDEPDPERALAATFGSAPGADVPDRDTWQRG